MGQRSDFYFQKNTMNINSKTPLNDKQYKDLRAIISPKLRGSSHISAGKLPSVYNNNMDNGNVRKQILSIESPTKSFDNNRLTNQKRVDSSDKYIHNGIRDKEQLKMESKNFSNFLLKDILMNNINGVQNDLAIHNNKQNKFTPGIEQSLSNLASQSTKSNYKGRGFSPNKILTMKNTDYKNLDKFHLQDFNGLNVNKEDIGFSTMVNQLNTNKAKNLQFNFIQPIVADLPILEPTKCSNRKNGVVKAYAANTNQGIIRNYNEDRVAIILNIVKPSYIEYKDEWPICSFFGVYDGHGGTACADYLRDNLHQFVIRDKNFPQNPKEALRKGFEIAEQQFMELAQKNTGEIDRSGSCAIVTLIVGNCLSYPHPLLILLDDTLYVANLGDSRAVMSCEKGKKVIDLSKDHKPMDEDEHPRIIKAGGKIYQSQITQNIKNEFGTISSSQNTNQVIMGPFRVLPGRLSVSRTFGDIEAKLPRYGGNPNVVIAEPDIRVFKLDEMCDFIILACDGIFDKMSSQDVMQCTWDSMSIKAPDIHQQCAQSVEALMKESLMRRTLDNVTVVMVALKGLKKGLFSKSSKYTKLIEHSERLYKHNNTNNVDPSPLSAITTLSSSEIQQKNLIKSNTSQSNRLKRIIDIIPSADKYLELKARGITNTNNINGYNNKYPSRQELRKGGNFSLSFKNTSGISEIYNHNKTYSDVIMGINGRSINHNV